MAYASCVSPHRIEVSAQMWHMCLVGDSVYFCIQDASFLTTSALCLFCQRPAWDLLVVVSPCPLPRQYGIDMSAMLCISMPMRRGRPRHSSVARTPAFSNLFEPSSMLDREEACFGQCLSRFCIGGQQVPEYCEENRRVSGTPRR